MNNCIPLPTAGAYSASPEACRLAAEVEGMLSLSHFPNHADQIDWYLRAGFEPAMIIEAAESAQLAPLPSWNYFRGIMRNCARDCCYTYQAYIARLAAWPKVKQVIGYQYNKGPIVPQSAAQ